jgi:HEAT repeat protein
MGLLDRFRKPDVEALAQTGDVTGLREALSYPHEAEVRSDAAAALGKLGERAALQSLLTAVKDDEPTVRAAAAAALGLLRDPGAIEPLESLQRDSNAEVIAAAVAALKSINDSGSGPNLGGAPDATGSHPTAILVASLLDGDAVSRQQAAATLEAQSWRPETQEQLAAYAFAKQAWSEVARCGDAALPVLLAGSRDADWHVRRQTALILSGLSHPDALEGIRAALEDADWRVRADAAKSLDTAHVAQCLRPLLLALSDDVQMVRDYATQALFRMPPSPEAAVGLLNALQDDDKRIRSGAKHLIKHNEDPDAVASVFALVEDEKAGHRDGVIRALHYVRNKKTLCPLIAALGSHHPHVRECALEILEDHHWSPSSEVDKANFLITRKDWRKFNELGADALPALCGALEDDDRQVRRHAVETIGRIGDIKALDPVVGALTDEYGLVRILAIEALGKIGTMRAMHPLFGMLNDEAAAVGEAAMKTLAEMAQNPYTSAALITALADETPATRAGAARLIREVKGPPLVGPLLATLEDEVESVRQEGIAALTEVTGKTFGEDAEAWRGWWDETVIHPNE